VAHGSSKCQACGAVARGRGFQNPSYAPPSQPKPPSNRWPSKREQELEKANEALKQANIKLKEQAKQGTGNSRDREKDKEQSKPKLFLDFFAEEVGAESEAFKVASKALEDKKAAAEAAKEEKGYSLSAQQKYARRKRDSATKANEKVAELDARMAEMAKELEQARTHAASAEQTAVQAEQKLQAMHLDAGLAGNPDEPVGALRAVLLKFQQGLPSSVPGNLKASFEELANGMLVSAKACAAAAPPSQPSGPRPTDPVGATVFWQVDEVEATAGGAAEGDVSMQDEDFEEIKRIMEEPDKKRLATFLAGGVRLKKHKCS